MAKILGFLVGVGTVVLFVLLLVGCASPIAPTSISNQSVISEESHQPVTSQQSIPSVILPPTSSIPVQAPCPSPVTYEAGQIKTFLNYVITNAVQRTKEEYGLVIQFWADDPLLIGTGIHKEIAGELRRNQPRVAGEATKYTLLAGVLKGLDSKQDFLDALRAATPSNIEVRLKGGEVFYGCLPAVSVLKGRIEGDW